MDKAKLPWTANIYSSDLHYQYTLVGSSQEVRKLKMNFELWHITLAKNNTTHIGIDDLKLLKVKLDALSTNL